MGLTVASGRSICVGRMIENESQSLVTRIVIDTWRGIGRRVRVAAVLVVTAGAAPTPDAWIEREAHVMGTRLGIRVSAADRAAAIRASEAALRAVREVEDRLSTWREGTDLAALNGAPKDRFVSVAGPLLHLLEEALRWSEETRGAFDPAVGALVDAWDLRGAGRRPSAIELERALASTGRRCFELAPRRGEARRRCPAAWLDAGGFGKGAALREARTALMKAGARAALLDFGGQQLALGRPEGSVAWPVAVAHPSRRARPALRLRVGDGSVATTGQSERGIATDDGRVGHVLDPRSGRPVPAWGSVTVVADDPLVADVLSTALFVMGPSAGMEWLRDRPGMAVLFLVEERGGLSVRVSAAMRPLLVGAPNGHLNPED